MDSCDIVIPVWNQLDVTKQCVDSIVRRTDVPFRLIMIDNGSESPTRDYMRGLAAEKGLNLLLIRNGSNLGFVKAVNQGLKAADSPYVCIMNNDTVATAGWLDEMMDVMRSDRRLGVLNPSSNTSGQFPQPGGSIDEYAASLKGSRGRIQELNLARGFCMLIRRELLDRIGLLDENYGIGYFEETDFSKRAQAAGFRIARAKAAYVYHKEGTTFKEMKDRDAIFRQNEDIYFKKWGRLVRAAYLVDSPSSNEKVDDIATAAARGGHQMIVFIKKGLAWPVRLDHFDIRPYEMGAAFFGAGAALQIIKRRRKKTIALVLTDNRAMGAFLKMTKPLHGADVMISPDKDEVMRALSVQSRQLK
jgi:GT2 family glycosyltransferase